MTPLPPPSAPRPVRAAVLALLAGYAVLALLLVAGVPARGGATALAVGLLGSLLAVAGTLLVLARALLRPLHRGPWAWFGTGLLLYTAGTVLGASGLPDPEARGLRLSEAGWLALFPCAYVALMLLLRRQARRVPPSMWLDGLVGGLGAGAVGAALASGALAEAQGRLVTVAYPLGDLVLVALVGLLFALAGWRPSPELRWTGLGLLAHTSADGVWLATTASGTYSPASPWPALLYCAAMVLVVRGAWSAPVRAEPRPLRPWALLLVPALMSVASVAVLVVAGLGDLAPAAVVLAGAAVLAAVARVGLGVRDAEAVAASRLEARTDPLTGLLNRRGFEEVVERRLDDPAGPPASVLLLDLDGFKEVNDSLGHGAGDELLVELGRRWARRLPEGAALARLGGDEFAVLADGERDGELLARALLDPLAEPVRIAGIALQPRVSIGLAAVRGAAAGERVGREELLRRADAAMYRAKRRGGGVAAHGPQDDDGRDRLQAYEDLHRALDGDPAGGRLVLRYQPQVRLDDGRVVGVEALLRWEHPRRGLLGPGDVLPVAEQTGRSAAVTRLVLGLAVAQTAAWRADGLDLRVSVNLTDADLIDARLPDDVDALLRAHALPADRLVLEVTEGALLKDRDCAVRVLGALRSLGLGVSLDDYGTGYSSLAYLHHLPASELKLDRSFVQPLVHDERAGAIVRSSVGLAHALGLPVVAEGIETEAQAAAALAAGCDTAQGFLWSRPLEPEALRALVQGVPRPAAA
ncbi:putative bifunctional diguanylate cyclase/phosphodiesterase [Vallicoccus soli]|uniref:Bifunctional diguanylate cyclase/phosphodiesterase n=1 Tax=Vallicoccus soli TaxID=2339232 RepID=A0A3A3Z216_9ACTN|nr:bifunctional diguanylate cyclase/phosphodiesterase [Vallicoccus soli]RJK96719.1 bifunctional diguanylate cyclase/phosphodiesterase [Vallicoccus soli]